MPRGNFFANLSCSEDLMRKTLSYLSASSLEINFISHMCTSFNKLNANIEEYNQWVDQLNLDEMLDTQRSDIEKYDQKCSDIFLFHSNGPRRQIEQHIYWIKEQIKTASRALQTGDLTSYNIPVLAKNTLDVLCEEYNKINNRVDQLIAALEASEEQLKSCISLC